jgi:hypothetical protein
MSGRRGANGYRPTNSAAPLDLLKERLDNPQAEPVLKLLPVYC